MKQTKRYFLILQLFKSKLNDVEPLNCFKTIDYPQGVAIPQKGDIINCYYSEFENKYTAYEVFEIRHSLSGDNQVMEIRINAKTV